MNKKVAEMITCVITTRIEEMINNGDDSKWKKPWLSSFNLPVNYITRKKYRGVNMILLAGCGDEFLTFNQIKKLSEKDNSIKLKKGSKSIPVIYWNWVNKEQEKKNGETEEYKVPFVKYYRVFNILDIENLPSKFETKEIFEHEAIENAESLINSYEVEIDVRKSDRAYYSPSNDLIVVPELNQYENKNAYYSTIFHEMIHSTGHKTRLNRFTETTNLSFNSSDYSKEELVAELGSAMMCAELKIEDTSIINNSVEYLRSWLKALKDDTSLIITASQQAQKAVDYILKKI